MKYSKAIIAVLVVLSITGCAQKRLHTGKQLLLGTIVEVTSPYPEAANIAFEEISRVEKIFSTYIKDSVISHLNKTGFLSTNFEVALLIEKAKEFYELTNGQFDITVGPLTKIWKEALIKGQLPGKKKIKDAKRLVGFNKVHINRNNNTIKFKKKGMRIDLGGIAKGYAVDAAVKELKRQGIDSAIINAGGDIYCLGLKFDQPWIVGLQHPRDKKKLITSLMVGDVGLATSGDYEQYVEIASKRYSHIINPKTGFPVENNIISVSVIAKDTLTADVVATCVFILGEDKGREVFENYPGVKKIIVITENDV